MAKPEDAARWIALESDDYDGIGPEGYGFGRATTDEVAAGIGVSTEEAYRLLKAAAKKGLVVQDKARRKGVQTKRYGGSQVGWAIWEVHLDAAQNQERIRRELKPNAGHYVWVLRPLSSVPLSTEGPYGPMTFEKAKQFARIGAQEGVHDRAVSLGKDPVAKNFRIEARYAARSGLRLI